MNPDQSKINLLTNACAQTGSYTFGGNVMQAVNAVYNTLKAKSASLSIEKGDYAEGPAKTFEVIYFAGPIEVLYQNSKYSIYIKVLLPPNFPEVAPITSVINIDTNVFMVNKEYAGGLLPDETFAINLFNASQWQFHKNFEAVYFELVSKLGSQFPFFKSSSKVKPQPPKYYPPLVSNFNQGGAGAWSQQGNFNQGQSGWGAQNQGYNQYGNYGQGQQSNFNSGYMPNPSMNRPGNEFQNGPTPQTTSFMNDQVSSLVLAVKSDIQTDKKTLIQLSKLRSENQTLADQYQSYLELLVKQNEKNAQNIAKLNQHRDSIKTVSIDSMIADGSIFKSEDRKSLDLIENLANLRAIEEADKEMQDLFKNDDFRVPFEDVFNMVERLAKQEFTLKSKIIELTKA